MMNCANIYLEKYDLARKNARMGIEKAGGKK